MKKWIIRIVIALVLLVAISVAMLFLKLNTIVKKAVETVGPQLTKVQVTLGSADISPFSGSGELKELFVGNPDGFKTPSAIKVGGVKVAVDTSSLTSDTIVVKEINIQAPEITFEGGFGGNNISKILDNVKSATGGDKPAAKAEPAAASGGGKKFIVKEVVVDGAKIHASLTGLGGKELNLPLPPLHLHDIGSPGNGVSAGELVKQIVEPLLSSVTKAVTDDAASIGKDALNIGKSAGKDAGDAIKNVTGGLKGLFK